MAASQQRPPSDARAAALASALTVGGTTAAVGAAGATLTSYAALNAAMLAALTRLLLSWKYDRVTVRWAIRVATRIVHVTDPSPAVGRRIVAPAEAETRRAERSFAAWFLERSTARVQARLESGVTPEEAQAAEERYVVQHLDAQTRRRDAARRVDAEAAKPGNVTVTPSPNADGGWPGNPDGIGAGPELVVLAWRAHADDKVTPECRAADGCLFYAVRPPVIGYPGMPHGGTCRCWPGKATAAEVARGRTVDEAVRAIIAAEPDHRPYPTATSTTERRTA